MDDRVSRLQQRRKVLDEEMHALQHSGILTPAEEATGKARQVLPDHHFEEFNRTLAQAYRHCADVRARAACGLLVGVCESCRRLLLLLLILLRIRAGGEGSVLGSMFVPALVV